MNFYERLRELLCRMYQELGRNCSELGHTPWSTITQFHAGYDQSGPPQFDTPQKRTDFIADLNATKALIDSPDSTLTAAEDSELRTLLGQITTDIGA